MYRNNTGEPQSLSNSNHMLGAPSVNNDLQVLTERQTGTPGLGALDSREVPPSVAHQQHWLIIRFGEKCSFSESKTIIEIDLTKEKHKGGNFTSNRLAKLFQWRVLRVFSSFCFLPSSPSRLGIYPVGLMSVLFVCFTSNWKDCVRVFMSTWRQCITWISTIWRK